MKNIVLFAFIALITSISIINCMDTKLQEARDKEKAYYVLLIQKHKNKLDSSIKDKIKESFVEQNLQPSSNLAEIIASYATLSDEEISDANKLLWQAVLKNDLNKVREAVSLGANVNNNLNGKCIDVPVFSAINEDRFFMVKLLLELGADINGMLYGSPISDFYGRHRSVMEEMLSKLKNGETLKEDFLKKMIELEAEPQPRYMLCSDNSNEEILPERASEEDFYNLRGCCSIL